MIRSDPRLPRTGSGTDPEAPDILCLHTLVGIRAIASFSVQRENSWPDQYVWINSMPSHSWRKSESSATTRVDPEENVLGSAPCAQAAWWAMVGSLAVWPPSKVGE